MPVWLYCLCTFFHVLLFFHLISLALQVVSGLQSAGVTILGGPRALAAGLVSSATPSFKTEYGDNTLSLELVGSMTEAIEHIHKYGSGHTEAIVTEDADTAQVSTGAAFLAEVSTL